MSIYIYCGLGSHNLYISKKCCTFARDYCEWIGMYKKDYIKRTQVVFNSIRKI